MLNGGWENCFNGNLGVWRWKVRHTGDGSRMCGGWSALRSVKKDKEGERGALTGSTQSTEGAEEVGGLTQLQQLRNQVSVRRKQQVGNGKPAGSEGDGCSEIRTRVRRRQ
jgi:hypothetical protein